MELNYTNQNPDGFQGKKGFKKPTYPTFGLVHSPFFLRELATSAFSSSNFWGIFFPDEASL